MNAWKVILATVVIFGAGVVTGGLLVLQVPRFHSNHARTDAGPSRWRQQDSPGRMKFELLHRMKRELNLTPEQDARIDRILSQSQERTRKLMEPIRPQLQEELRKTREDFRAVLAPEQQARFDALLRRPGHLREPHPFPARTQEAPAH